MTIPENILPLNKVGENYFLDLPFLVKGKLVDPPESDPEKIIAAFEKKVNEEGKQPRDVTYLKLDNAQVLREPLIDREAMVYHDSFLYQVMPLVNPVEAGYFDPSLLVDELYNMPYKEVLSYLDRVSEVLAGGGKLAARGHEIAELTSDIPDGFLGIACHSFGIILSPETASKMAENELGYLGRSGSEYLDGWVETPLAALPGAAELRAKTIFGDGEQQAEPKNATVRAMPTRQLHITAGNAPAIPVISVMRSLATKSPALIKMPYGVTVPGALLGMAMVEAGADHPLTKNTSIVYWQGGAEEVEDTFYRPAFFDRIVVWGAPDAVSNVKKKALFTKVLTFNPRYGVSFIGREAFPDHLEEVALKASTDSMIWNQKACIASLIHYVEGSEEDALTYAEKVAELMKRWDESMPNLVPPAIAGQVRRMRRGKLAGAKWFTNQKDGHFQSAVVYVPGEFDIMDHPMWRVIIVRRVDDLSDCMRYLHAAVSTVGIFPEERRIALRDYIAARGVSNIVPLGQNERLAPGMPHDGMMVLSELVDWKNA